MPGKKKYKSVTGFHVTDPRLLSEAGLLPVIIPPAKNLGGRPSTFTEELAERVLDHVAQGKFIVDIGGDGLPSWRTIYRWADDRPEFRQALARAHEDGAHALLAEADQMLKDATRDTIQVVREQVQHIRWRVSRLNPGAYGDRSELRVTGSVEHVHKISDDAPAWIRERLDQPRPPTPGMVDVTPPGTKPERQH